MWRELSWPKKGEDASAFIESGDRTCAAVADGVGSLSGGGVASRAVIELVKCRANMDELFNFGEIFSECKAQLSRLRTPELKLGTTLTVVEIVGHTVRYGHVGDCRLYHLRGNGLKTVTEDQTELNYLLKKGVINKYDAKLYRRANVLMSWLAPDKDFKLASGEFQVSSGDRLIICSDGFYKCAPKQMLRDISVGSRSYELFIESIVDRVTNAERSDDATALIVEIE